MKTTQLSNNEKNNPEPHWFKKIITSHLFALIVKSSVVGLMIFGVISSGGILAIIGAVLATTILVSTVGKFLVDALVLKNYNSLNQKLQPNNNKNIGSSETSATIKPHDTLAKVDKVNNIVRAILTFTQIGLLIGATVIAPPVGLALGIVLGIKALLSAGKAVSSIKTMSSLKERETIVRAKDINNVSNNVVQEKPAVVQYTPVKGFFQILWLTLKDTESTKYQEIVKASKQLTRENNPKK